MTDKYSFALSRKTHVPSHLIQSVSVCNALGVVSGQARPSFLHRSQVETYSKFEQARFALHAEHTKQCAVLGMLLFLMCLPVHAAVDWGPVNPDELKMTSETLAPGAQAVILYRQVDRDDSTYPFFEDNYVRIKILTEEGRKFADVEIPFYKEEDENVVRIKARTIRPDGSIVNFDGKPFDKTIVKAKGLKYRAKTFALPNVQPGGIIEYSYRKYYGVVLYNAHWTISEDLFTKKAKFSMKPFDADPSVGVQWSWNSLPPGTAEPKRSGNDIIKLEVNNVPAFQKEDFMPPSDELKSRVDFVYVENKFDTTDPGRFWKGVGKYKADYIETYVLKRKALEPVVAQIVSPNDSPESKLRAIYARIQQLRNTSYEPTKTEQELKRDKADSLVGVDTIWQRGYGDRIQLNLLFLALVRVAGFEAFDIEVAPRSRYFFHPQVMDSYRLSENVILVKLNGSDLYCDPGSEFAPFGLLPWRLTAVQGLKLDKTGGTLVQIPQPSSSTSKVERFAALKISTSGDLEGKLKVQYTGQEAMVRRAEERNEDDTTR